LPGQAKLFKFPGNSQATLFASQVIRTSNQTGLKCSEEEEGSNKKKYTVALIEVALFRVIFTNAFSDVANITSRP
jgi:hypothetical protein